VAARSRQRREGATSPALTRRARQNVPTLKNRNAQGSLPRAGVSLAPRHNRTVHRGTPRRSCDRRPTGRPLHRPACASSVNRSESTCGFQSSPCRPSRRKRTLRVAYAEGQSTHHPVWPRSVVSPCSASSDSCSRTHRAVAPADAMKFLYAQYPTARTSAGVPFRLARA